MTTALLAAAALALIGLLVSLGLVLAGARGPSRVLAVLGTVLLFLGVLSRFVRTWLVDRYLETVDTATIVSVLAAEIALGGVLTGAGVLLVSGAVVIASGLPKLS